MPGPVFHNRFDPRRLRAGLALAVIGALAPGAARGQTVSPPIAEYQERARASFQLQPRSTYTVFYEAAADGAPAWFTISSAMSGARTDNGLNLRIILPHV